MSTSKALSVGQIVYVHGRQGTLACEHAVDNTWDVLYNDGGDEFGIASELISLTISARKVKQLPQRAFQVDSTRAWDIVRSTRGDAATIPLSGFDSNQMSPKRDGMVRFVCISDTHSYESKAMSMATALESIPDGDVLLHCGDFSNVGRLEEVASFAEWFGQLPHARKIIIAGNHDLSLDAESYESTAPRFGHGRVSDAASICARARACLESIPRCEYLQDSGTQVDGIRVWGSPWQPEFCDWAFNLPRGEPCRAKWRLIPQDTDVLLTHGPPLGHGDLTSGGVRAGCLDLLEEIQTRIRPQYHCFGHIHEGHGVTTDGTTTYVNASTCNLKYRPINTAIVFDIAVPRVDQCAGSATGASTGVPEPVVNKAEESEVVGASTLPVPSNEGSSQVRAVDVA
mmetsp:Transcript_36318/g.95747  ORF Transcript_36318/g.95747 Transcript_36318/m.95747 type:complete len:399 (-) Transcript_36318:304-1500(-)